jgi:DNA-binding transcriptional MerR regulator
LSLYRGTDRTLVVVATFTIGTLAQQAGVHIETIRYYERRGLLRDPPRSVAGYRQYSASDLWRLQFIARAKQLGFTLAEIGSLVGEDTGGTADSVLSMARSKIAALEFRQRTIEETRARLLRLVDICADPGNEDCTALRVTS